MSEFHNKISRLSGRPTVYVDRPKWIVQLALTFLVQYLQYQPPGWQNMSEIHNKISRLSGRPTV